MSLFRILKEFLMFLPPKAAALAKFALNHSLPKEKQPKFSTKNSSLQIFILNYALAAVTFWRSENFFRAHDEILLLMIFLSETKSAVAYNSRYFLAILPPKTATLVATFQKGSWESKRH